MSERLTIAVPKSLYMRLQPVKQRLNISAICQEALDMAITLQELKTDAVDRNHLIERLKLERQAMLTQVKQEGFKLGLKSANTLSYQDFQHLEQRSRLGLKLDNETLSDLWEFLDSHHYPQDARFNEPGVAHLLTVNPHNKGAFVEGWIEGVLSVWQEIKQQVDTEPMTDN